MSLRRVVPCAAGIGLLLAIGASLAVAGDGGTAVVLDALPPSVAAATWCAEEGSGFATRRDFAGRIIFVVECPGNHANFMQALVAADDAAGTDARALVFPTPYPADPDNPNDVLSNVGWHEGGIVSDLFVDPEAIDGPCRHEGRWRIGDAEPELISWRETKDCEGRGGWTVLIGG
jgi:hypothetical protein